MIDNQLFESIKKLSKSRAITIKELCQKIEVSEAGLYKTFKNNSIKVETLQKIADVLGVDIREFFGGISTNDAELEKKYNDLIGESRTLSHIAFFLSGSLSDLIKIVDISYEFIYDILPENDRKYYGVRIQRARELVENMNSTNSTDIGNYVHNKIKENLAFLKDIDWSTFEK